MSRQRKKQKTNKSNMLSVRQRKALSSLNQNTSSLASSSSSSSTPKERYSDDDFVSFMLIKWPFEQIVETSKLLVMLLNRRLPPNTVGIPERLRPLLCYRFPSEYADTLFAEHTPILCDGMYLSFRRYYTMVYKEARAALRMMNSGSGGSSSSDDDKEYRQHMRMLLRACFLIALVYEPRIRRFVFTKHDIHGLHLSTQPPSTKKTREFLSLVCPWVDRFLGETMAINEMTESAVTLWQEKYMFRLE